MLLISTVLSTIAIPDLCALCVLLMSAKSNHAVIVEQNDVLGAWVVVKHIDEWYDRERERVVLMHGQRKATRPKLRECVGEPTHKITCTSTHRCMSPKKSLESED